MNFKQVNRYRYVEVEPRHGAAVGAIHARNIEQSLLSELGEDLLGPLYTVLIEQDHCVGFVMLEGDEVVGFCLGRDDKDRSIGRTAVRGWRRLLPPVIRLALRRPQAIFALIRRLGQGGHVECGPGIGEYMTVAIDPGHRSGSRAVTLSEMTFAKLRDLGCRKARWETMGSNVRAQRFYPKIHGRVIGESEVDGEKVLWYERDLTS